MTEMVKLTAKDFATDQPAQEESGRRAAHANASAIAASISAILKG